MRFYFNIETFFLILLNCAKFYPHTFPFILWKMVNPANNILREGGGSVTSLENFEEKKNFEIPLQTAPLYLSVEKQVVTHNSL